ncbi:MAG: type II toxin-antitoxin system PemK/MazF family toxin [Flavobacteriales bacterium]
MEGSLKGQVVIVPFPFSDLSGSKRRPALVIADWGGADVVLCQITSKAKFDGKEVPLSAADFTKGGLPVASNIRPNKLFTADKATLLGAAGTISEARYQEVVRSIVALIS